MNKPELSINRAITVPSNRPNEAAEKARSEKPLTISSMAMSRPPKPKPINTPRKPSPINSGRTWLTAKPPSVDRLRNKTRRIQTDINLTPRVAAGIKRRRRPRFSFLRSPQQSVAVQVAAQHRQVTDQLRHPGRQFFVLQQTTGQSLSRLEIRQQTLRH